MSPMTYRNPILCSALRSVSSGSVSDRFTRFMSADRRSGDKLSIAYMRSIKGSVAAYPNIGGTASPIHFCNPVRLGGTAASTTKLNVSGNVWMRAAS